eukprot:TRINITY_DN25197_c1_g1_i2.p1 TRINITY_DN25197_c1_g1~~TRINITY_DN25197_c1_g1_i2.p1  ORF type:complete len:467 (-),score=96.51 TRINITY_DN25197_c1_g1_i2:133-1533(-)
MPPKAIFKGHTFAISGKLSQPRKEHEDLIRKHGGETASTVTAAVTMLISNEEDVKACTAKVATAKGRGIPIVTEGYLGACILAKRILDQNCFLVKGTRAKKRKAAAKAAGGAVKKKKAAGHEVVELSHTIAVIPKSGLSEKAAVAVTHVSSGFVTACVTWDVELVLTDIAAGKDKFYNMQLLASEDGTEYWAVQNWGKTGMDGAVHIDGPFSDFADAKRVFKKKYRQKTGNVWGQVGASFAEVPGKYRLLAKAAEEEDEAEAAMPGEASASSSAAPARAPAAAAARGGGRRAAEVPGKWQYYLHNKVDGKELGWYDYDKSAGDNMEKFWKQFERDPTLNVRLIQSDYFKYEVDFGAMIQKNTKSGMRRVVRRIADGQEASSDPPDEIPEPGKPDPSWKAAADDSEDEDDASGGGSEEDDEDAGERRDMFRRKMMAKSRSTFERWLVREQLYHISEMLTGTKKSQWS